MFELLVLTRESTHEVFILRVSRFHPWKDLTKGEAEEIEEKDEAVQQLKAANILAQRTKLALICTCFMLQNPLRFLFSFCFFAVALGRPAPLSPLRCADARFPLTCRRDFFWKTVLVQKWALVTAWLLV